MKKETIRGVIAVIFIAGGLAIYQSSQYVKDKSAVTTDTENVISDTEEKVTFPKAVVKEFTIVGTNFAFSPSTISVKKGDVVTIVFKNGGGMHDFKIDKYNVATKVIKTDAEEVLQFTADKVGSFEYYCSVGTHRQMGMKGMFVVTE